MPPIELPVDTGKQEIAEVPSSREFKYYPDDFGKLLAKVEHMNLTFDVFEGHTVVENDFTLTVTESCLQKLSLDAKNLEVLEVALYDSVKGKGKHNKKIEKKSLPYIYDKDADKLHLTLPQEIKKGKTITLYFKTITKPTKNILEGLYYDETPEGCPPTQITQCQQWGFQRLTPCFDDMTAKCTYTTTILADSRYTNMISNGNAAPEFRDANGIPTKKDMGNSRSMICYYNHTTPMAPYLFFIGVGTYATFRMEFEYPNGKTFLLELLALPDADKAAAERALEILYHGVMWIHLHTGPEKYKAFDVKQEIWELVKKRDGLKEAFQKKKKEHVHTQKESIFKHVTSLFATYTSKEAKELAAVRKELKKLASSLKLGYMYTGDVYREIAMQNSNFGGMENVGNTTITANRIMPVPQITDESFEYMMEVKTHEFYHNLNGSEVTGKDPFVLWLNEAVTCHIETDYLSHIMGDAYTRITRVMTLHAPMFGTFAEESSPAALPIIPEGFNTPDELITGMTYVKAPEFVQMIETLMGREKFVKGLDVYHRRFKHKNATTEDLLAAMEEVSGLQFKKMAEGWLTRTGFPRVFVSTSYEEGKVTMIIEQKGFDAKGPWQFPYVFGLVDKNGKDLLATQKHWIKNEKEILTVAVAEEPAYVSFNRNHTLYGKVFWKEQTQQQLEFQALTDSDIVNRYMAFSTLLDQEKVKLVKNIEEPISPFVLSLYGKILVNTNLTPEVKALFLSITESVRDEEVMHQYQEIYVAKEKLRKTVATMYQTELLALYRKLAAEKFSSIYIEQQLAGMKNRDLKNLVLSLLASLDDKETWALVKKQLETATHASDKNTAMALYLNSSSPDRLAVLEQFKKDTEKNLLSWESFLRIIGSSNSADVISLMKKLEKDKHFRIEQSNDQRALYLSFASNRKKSLLTADGLGYLTEIMITISRLNEYTGFHLLAAFSDLEKLDFSHQVQLVGALYAVRDALNKKEHPSVYNNIQRILKNCPKAVKAWKEGK